MTTTTYILIYCYPLASQHLVRQDVPTERFQNRQLCTWCPRFKLHNLQHGMLLGPWSSQTGISHSITLQNLTGLAPLQHPPWLWLPGLSQTLFQMKNCSKTTCFSSRATTFATSSSTVFAMAASLAPPAMEQSDGVCTSWCNLNPSDWVCLILRVCHSGLLWILESQKREIDPQSSSFSTILVSKCAVVPSRRTLPFRGNSRMISEHMIPRPKAKIARGRAKCLFDGRHLCFADDTILASVFLTAIFRELLLSWLTCIQCTAGTSPSSSPYWHPEHWKPATTPELMNQRRRLAVNAIFQHATDCITHLCLMLLTSSSVQWHCESQLHLRRFSPGIIDIICCSRCFMSFHFSSLTRKLEGLLHRLQRHLFIVITMTMCANISNEFIPSFNGLLSDFSTGRPTCHKEVNQTNTYR